jgi:hypothetical protein
LGGGKEDQEVQEGGRPSPPAEATIAVSGSPEVVLDAIAVCEEVVENVRPSASASLGATILS